MYDLVSIGSVTRDIFVPTDRGKIFRTPKDKLAPVWLGFELGEKIYTEEVIEDNGGVATNLSIGTKKLGLNSVSLGPAEPAVSVIIIDKKTGERVIFYQKSSGIINVGKLRKIQTKWLSVSSLTGKCSRQADQIVKYVTTNKTGLILLPSTSQIRDGFPDLKKLFRNSKILILNRNEALEVTSKMKVKIVDTKDLFKNLHNLGPEIVCITDGTKGVWTSNGKIIIHCPVLKVKAVDLTGAGDAYAAGFLGFFIRGKSFDEALKAGIVNSASVVQYIGTTKGLLDKGPIIKKINSSALKVTRV